MEQRIQIGDLVTRVSYGHDQIFQVVKIDPTNHKAWLKGSHIRLLADAPLDDLQIYHPGKKTSRFQSLILEDYLSRKKLVMKEVLGDKTSDYGQILGSVLHIDGDQRFLQACLDKYDELNIHVNGYHISEEEQPQMIKDLLHQHRPDVLVVTGHDGRKKSGDDQLSNYHSSAFFVESVKKARQIVMDRDSLVIFAGACQSHYQALIQAGANYASSPERVNIHKLDPVMAIEKVVTTSIHKIVAVDTVLAQIFSGPDGVGGMETRGKKRLILPKI